MAFRLKILIMPSNTQNLILPAGTEKIGLYEYYVNLNASPILSEELNNFPVKSFKGQ